jgi:hypothetical protein
MLRHFNESDLSELEQEFELEMDEMELDQEEEAEEEFEDSAEYEDQQNEFEATEESAVYADRFYELSQMGYESETEVDERVNELLDEMEQDFFWKRIKRGAKGFIKNAIKNLPAVKGLQGLAKLASGDLKGTLKSLAGAAIGSVIPGGAAVLPALNALGFEASEEPGVNREAWGNYAEVCREAFEHLAQNLNANTNDPLEASRRATSAFQTGFKRVQAKQQARLRSGRSPRRNLAASSKRKRRVVYLAPGESIIVRRR